MSEEMEFRCQRGRTPDTCKNDCVVVDEEGASWFCSKLLRPYEVVEDGERITKWEKVHIMPPTPEEVEGHG